MSHQISYCTNTPFIKKCDTIKYDNGFEYKPSINVDANIIQYKYTPNFNDIPGSHQLSLCYPSPIIRPCVGFRIDKGNIVPYTSLGISLGSLKYQYSKEIDALRTNNCITTISQGVVENDRIVGGTLTTICPDSKSTLHIKNREELTIERIENVLETLNKKLDNSQTKIEQTMKEKGVTWHCIGVSSGDQVIQTNIIENLLKNDPTLTIFDILSKIKANDIVIPDDSLKKFGKWYKVDGTFFPDCCDLAFNCGYYIDYHIKEKIDYCRLCLQKFRLEYFL